VRFAVNVDEHRGDAWTLVLGQLQQFVADVALWTTVAHRLQLKSDRCGVWTTGHLGRRSASVGSVRRQPGDIQDRSRSTTDQRQRLDVS